MNAFILLPYEFSPTVLILSLGAIILYLRGLAALKGAPESPSAARIFWFLLGVVLMYGVLQTRYDYMSQHMFFLHRLQHLVLHHMAPFIIVLARPGPVLAAGLPASARRRLRKLGRSAIIRGSYRVLQQPVIAAIIFVGLIYLWLTPGLHFYAMLNIPLYNVMNWSMAIDGLLFWYVMLDPHRPEEGGLAYGWRIIVLTLVIFPQIGIGAFIALAHQDIYHVYAVCGRLWPISPIEDQRIGGLITWIPAGMMSVIGAILMLHRWMHADDSGKRMPKPEKKSYA